MARKIANSRTSKPARLADVSAAMQARVAALDWKAAHADLDATGHARLPGLLTAAECDELIALWDERERFRSFVDMGQHRYGEGHYRYFARPLPPLVRALRVRLFPRLAAIANAWNERLGDPRRFPTSLAAFERVCAESGQTRPTPLLLRYDPDGFNCLHQDRYGAVAFPLQVAVLLTRPSGREPGGEFLLAEQRPRQQSRAEAIALQRGEAIVFPGFERPVEGRTGPYRAVVKHGVSRVRSGRRITLGVIFHDAA